MKIKVSYFPHKWHEQKLMAYFADYGPAGIEIQKDARGYSFALIDIPDIQKAKCAIKECNGVQSDPQKPTLRLRVQAEQEPHSKHPSCRLPDSLSDDHFPYFFATRESTFDRNEPPFHDKLETNRCDIAFKITWKAESTVAANPCTTTGPAIFPENPEDKDSFYAGYNKRWLTIDNKLAISPFTVKSSIAGGFANLMGGCYRVNTKTEIHNRSKEFILHEDTIPAIHKSCNNMKLICPRCQMFGMTDHSKNVDLDAVGFRGRFKSVALISEITLDEEDFFKKPIPVESDMHNSNYQDATMIQWKCNGEVKCRQYLMPIAGSPKPNKLDVNGYFYPHGALLKGVKNNVHGSLGAGSLDDWSSTITELDKRIEPDDEGKFKISHKLRNYAVVCESGTMFHGTVGAENCSPDEVAALLMLLEHTIAGHGFKIGLGKSWGLGSMISSVKQIWVRRTTEYSWTPSSSFENTDWEKLVKEVDGLMPGVESAVNTFKKVSNLPQKINPYCTHEKKHLKFPDNLRYYWRDAKKTGLCP